MANHKSAIKRHKQSEKRKRRNFDIKRAMRSTLKTARAEIAEGGAKADAGKVKEGVAALAKAASKGVMHKRTAARRISRLMRAANKS
jgi:small subunit ribosomal protein S20